jgi:hypothetical protein
VAVIPETRFAIVGDDRVAYQVFGEGPLDLVLMLGSSVAIDCLWEYAPAAEMLNRLASFCRVIVSDRRGSGASDALPIEGLASWEYWADDTNYEPDIFLRDRQTGTTERVDVTNDGSQLFDGSGTNAFVSDDGRFVSFQTSSPELVPPRDEGAFVRDRTAGTTTEVSVLPDGSLSTYAIVTGMSSDGRYVAFLGVEPTGSVNTLYVHDLQTNTTKLVASSLSGNSWSPISDNGQIAFVSADSTLVPGDTNGYPDVFVEDIATGAIDRVNLTPSGDQESGNTIGPGNTNAARVEISRDGRYVEFWSASANMGVATNDSAVFLRDRVAGTTELASVLPFSSATCNSREEGGISNDGRYVTFSVLCEDAQSNVTYMGTFVRDRVLGTTTQADTLSDGTLTNGHSATGLMSADGTSVAFESDATNLVTNDTNNNYDIFMHRIG